MLRYLCNVLAFCFNFMLALLFILLTWLDSLSYYAPVVPNPARFLKTLLLVHGYQIFKNKAFNGDPHPSNILLMPDEISFQGGIHLAELIIAPIDRNLKSIVEKAKKMRVSIPKRMNPYFIEVITTIEFGLLDNDIFGKAFRASRYGLHTMRQDNAHMFGIDTVVTFPGEKNNLTIIIRAHKTQFDRYKI
ncbi:hypothetical protein RFI_39930 [Reticulomyxa filosa]|uniref:Uncharacterized protein n=1 Tax=Reticulomyxa filosa TaxID=46433 RepID=X6LA29_RETFI|nr:hypothetical protein RFI_39930 [Reticulomyxa filosa]|eukprot:ETN97599.1 hypothetical protein RFI_39930 [Reticulomyxa filosa]